MADYEFKINNKDFKNKMERLQRMFPNFLKTILRKIGLRLLAKVKKLTPVDTGLLRRSWFLNQPKVSENNASIEIKNNVKYALAVEMGRVLKNGGFVPGYIMLKLGLRELESQMPQILETEIQKFLDKQGVGK